ncbi:MAG: hypothetical protein HZT40_13680 [Candidatus Thiothrix singaporensis]|uniref:START domain-containing protein n=1 Tax=Candidatus Thiothrix singaporensis TaxID=2799669 RepID=A0A7L6ATN0_9GAMM|nr:MAG: hypothetical protein HZT40_13680 [Candidatus Thiothrix singaporensis]
MKRLLAAVFLLLLAMSPGYADGGGWVVKQDEGGIQVRQQKTGSPHETTNGVVEMATTLDALAAVLKDISACPRWVHGCVEGRLVKTLSPAERITYTVVDAPFPLENRDMYIDSVIRYNRSTSTLTITLTGKENYAPAAPSRTRVLGLRGSWVFQQASPGHVRVSYQIQLDPQAPFNGPAMTIWWSRCSIR